MTDFAVAPLRKSTLLFMLGLIGLLPMAIVVGTLLATRPPGSGLWLLILLPLALLAALALATRRRAIRLSDGGRLRIEATFYTLTLPLSDIDLEQARALNLDEHRELRPFLKTNGYAVPGFSAGHFRSRDKRKLFCLVTDPKVLALPLRDGRTALLSAERPQALLDALRRADRQERGD